MTDTTKKIPVTVHLSPALIAEIDACLDGRSRSAWIERVLRAAVNGLNVKVRHSDPDRSVDFTVLGAGATTGIEINNNEDETP